MQSSECPSCCLHADMMCLDRRYGSEISDRSINGTVLVLYDASQLDHSSVVKK